MNNQIYKENIYIILPWYWGLNDCWLEYCVRSIGLYCCWYVGMGGCMYWWCNWFCWEASLWMSDWMSCKLVFILKKIISSIKLLWNISTIFYGQWLNIYQKFITTIINKKILTISKTIVKNGKITITNVKNTIYNGKITMRAKSPLTIAKLPLKICHFEW